MLWNSNDILVLGFDQKELFDEPQSKAVLRDDDDEEAKDVLATLIDSTNITDKKQETVGYSQMIYSFRRKIKFVF